MSPYELARYVRKATKTNSATFPDADILALVKIFKDDLVSKILDIDEDYFGMPYTTDLLPTATTREYPFPLDLAGKIKRVEAKLDGTNWIKLNELDLTQYARTSDETAITANFSNNESYAFYDIFREALTLYCGTVSSTVTGGLKLIAFSLPADITDLASTTDMSQDPDVFSHGFPRQLHLILADKIVIFHKSSGDKPIPLTQSEQNIEKRLSEALDGMANKNKDRTYKASVPNYGNNGYSY